MSEEKKVEETQTTPQEEKKEETTEVVVPEKFKSIVSEIEKMSVLDLSELVKILEDKFGVSAAAPMMMGVPQGTIAGAEIGAEEKSEFDVELTSVSDNKIGVIKAVREIIQIGLSDAKTLVEKAPVMVKEGVKKEDAEEMKKKLEATGASVTLK